MESSLPSFNHIFLARIRASHPEFLEDEKLLETLLLALVAKQRNIIVYTTEDDISRVLKLIVNVGLLPLAFHCLLVHRGTAINESRVRSLGRT